MLAEGLTTLLAGDGPTAAILGTSRSDKTNGIFPGQMPEAAPLPALVYSDIHQEGLMTLDGPDAFTSGRMQFSCRGASYADAKHLARAVRIALENFTGALGDGTQVDSMHRVSEVDGFEDAPFSYVTHVDFEVAYRDVGS